MNKTYFILDESGSMHADINKNRYFIIGGFVTNEISKARSIQRTLEKEIYLENNINPKNGEEIKGSNLTNVQRAKVLSEYIKCEDIFPVAIVVDKKHTNRGFGENKSFNYFANVLIEHIHKYSPCKLDRKEEIVIIHDQRSIKTDSQYDFEQYTELNLQKNGIFNKFSYKGLNSKQHYEVRIADIISNSVYHVHHLSYRGKYIKKNTNFHSNVFYCHFPYRNFGK